MLADFYVHSEFSDDSVYPMEQVAADAFEIGLDAVCFTDHVDYGVKPDAGEQPRRLDPGNGKPVTNVDYPAYFAKLDQVRRYDPFGPFPLSTYATWWRLSSRRRSVATGPWN